MNPSKAAAPLPNTIRHYQHGPHFLNAEQVEFRLWAPSAKTVELLLGDTTPQLMEPQKNGWHRLTRAANAGELYRYRIDGESLVPDPASRFQPDGLAGFSELVAPHLAKKQGWQGRPWHEAVIYELHVGTFSQTGTYAGLEARLDALAELGITAIELMPLAAFEGRHGWGYDGVLPYAPDASYGTPEDLRRLIDAAHARGIMLLLDVVYNHFGPSGNYLHQYAQPFFTEKHQTPWGAAINFEEQQAVRDFFIDNALYWIEEFGFDGLRFDAVHAIEDASAKHFIADLGESIRARLPAQRHVHLILENGHNEAKYLNRDTQGNPIQFTAQWNDDIHHNLHHLLTGESGGYYADYTQRPLARLARCLTEGFDYQGEHSAHDGKARGEKSNHLPPGAFIGFLQNHDQIGNRAMGERLTALVSPEQYRLGLCILLLSPQPPMLFMGEEWGSTAPFLYFCDFEGELADAVREGRRREFKSFPQFSSEEARAHIPDPSSEETFLRSKLNWSERDEGTHAQFLQMTRDLLALRQAHILPLLNSGWRGNELLTADDYLHVRWHFNTGTLELLANFSDREIMPSSVVLEEPVWGTSRKLLPWSAQVNLSKSLPGTSNKASRNQA